MDGLENGFWFHEYDVPVEAGLVLNGPEALAVAEEMLIRFPVPGENALPAILEGQLNDVGKVLELVDDGVNMVRSFLVETEIDGMSEFVVNLTVEGDHMLEEGFVMRYLTMNADGNITLHTYDEGNAFKQSKLSLVDWETQVENV